MSTKPISEEQAMLNQLVAELRIIGQLDRSKVQGILKSALSQSGSCLNSKRMQLRKADQWKMPG